MHEVYKFVSLQLGLRDRLAREPLEEVELEGRSGPGIGAGTTHLISAALQ